MKYFLLSTLLLLGLLSACCSDQTRRISIEDLSNSRSLSIRPSHVIDDNPIIDISFTSDCVLLLAKRKITKIILQTTEGEIIQDDINQKSGEFCSPKGSIITSIMLYSVDKNGTEYQNEIEAQ